MIVENTPIEGLKVIRPKVFQDDRGFFVETFNQKRYKENGILVDFVQDNLSKSHKNVLRGLHFQAPPHEQAKLVQVVTGAVIDIAVDIRKESPTYGQSFSIMLSEEEKTQFYIPAGFAHGFLTLRDNTIFSYKCSNIYHPESEGSILWKDSDLGIDWKCENPIVSEKDQIAKAFKDFKSPF